MAHREVLETMAAGSKRKKRSGGRKRRSSGLRRIARLVGLGGRRNPATAGATGDDIQRIARSGLFDAGFYRDQIAGKEDWQDPADELSETELIAHYIRRGAAAWLNPSRAFDTGLYLHGHPDVARSAENPLLHHIKAREWSQKVRNGLDDTTEKQSVPRATARVIASTRRAFVIPATLAPRNTTRYRLEHLVETVGESALTIVDPRQPPPDLLAQIEQGAMVILQRLALNDENRDFLKRIRASAALVAYDIDDQIFDANKLEGWRIRGLEYSPGQYAQCMALADHVLVSTSGLRAEVEGRFGRPAHVVSNCLGRKIVALSEAARLQQRDPHAPFVLGYASGSHTHDEDLKIALPAIAAFLRANPAAEFHAIGHMDFPDELRRTFGDRVRHRKAVSWRKLPEILAGFSVQIIPLVDCPFNRCKSHIRFLEAAAVDVPSIVSRVGEPGASVIDGVTGLACSEDPVAWQQAMQSLHDDAELRRRLAENARRFVIANFTTDAPLSRRRTARVFDSLGLVREDA